MSSFNVKRCFASAGVTSTASDTDSVASGGRALEALYTSVPCGYWPGWPPLQPVKLVDVVPMQLTTPDEPNAITFRPDAKLDVLPTPIVSLGSVSGLSVSEVGAEAAAKLAPKILPSVMPGASTRF